MELKYSNLAKQDLASIEKYNCVDVDSVNILGVPHVSMDIDRHLEREKEEQNRARDDDKARER